MDVNFLKVQIWFSLLYPPSTWNNAQNTVGLKNKSNNKQNNKKNPHIDELLWPFNNLALDMGDTEMKR